jgi:DNA-binding NtrC family response regulator
MRVLFKEDDDLAARTLERQLRKLGHASERIINVEDLLKHETELEPEVIITDIFMPDIEGLAFIRLLKRSDLSGVPILAISGGGTYRGGIKDVEYSFVARAAVDFGAIRFLRKPISLQALQTALEDCVRSVSSA